MIRPLEIILIDDDTVRPPKPKFVACVCPSEGLFYRINSRNHWRPCIPVVRIPHHKFLHHDSFLECGDPLILDDYVIEESLRRSGVIGCLHRSLCEGILSALAQARYLKESDKALIRASLDQA